MTWDRGEDLPTVLRVAYGAFLAGIVVWAIPVFLQNSSAPDALLRPLMVPAPSAAVLLGVLYVFDVRGSTTASAARMRRQRIPHVLPPHGFLRFLGGLLVIGGLVMLVTVLTQPVGEI